MPTALVIISCLAGEARGQAAWQYTGNGAQCEPTGYAYWHGRVGIRTQTPAVPLHIHSGACVDGLTYYPAIARLQTQAADYAFGKSEIQFWSGAQGVQDWYVSAIKPMTMAAPPFNTSDPLAPLQYLGGMAFFCSGTGQRPQGNEIQVMRLYDQRVAINSERAVGRFDVGTSPTNSGGWRSRIVFDDKPDGTGGASGPVIRMFRPDGWSLGDKEFGTAFSWWLQCSNDAHGSLKFRSGNTAAGGNAPNVDEEIPNTRMTLRSNGNVGVNTEWPISTFQVQNGAALFNGTQGGTPRNEDWSQLGAGTRLMWIPEKAAFRAGRVNDNEWDDANIGIESAAFGWQNKVASYYSFAAGWGNTIEGGNGRHGGTAFGHGNKINYGLDVFVAGINNEVTGNYSYGIGNSNFVRSNESVSIGHHNAVGLYTNDLDLYKENYMFGRNLQSYGEGSVTIGTGAGTALTNVWNHALAIGLNTSIPTMLVMGGTGDATYGKVAINSYDPQTDLALRKDVTIGWDGVQSPAANTSLIVEKKVGIGTGSPACSLGVNGNVSIGWSGTQGMPTIPSSGNPGADANPVSLLVEKTVIVGGTDYVHRTIPTVDYGASNGASMLQVWGNAIKYQSGGSSAWDIPSDSRYKKDVRPYRDGLDLLKRINPVRFRYNEKLGLKDSGEGIGVLAQDIQEIFPYTVREDTLRHVVRTKEERRYQIDTVEKIIRRITDTTVKDEHGHYGYKDTVIYRMRKKWVVEPAEFATESLPILIYNPSALTYTIINSIKEMDSTRIAETAALRDHIALLDAKTAALLEADSLQGIEIGALKEQNDAFAAKLEALSSSNDSLRLVVKNHEERIARLEAKNEIPLDEAADVILEQNNPNPFAESTVITYYIPAAVSGTPELIVTPSSQSQILQTIPLTKGLPQQLTVSASAFDTGVYVYSIVSNGKVLASKKMIIIK